MSAPRTGLIFLALVVSLSAACHKDEKGGDAGIAKPAAAASAPSSAKASAADRRAELQRQFDLHMAANKAAKEAAAAKAAAAAPAPATPSPAPAAPTP